MSRRSAVAPLSICRTSTSWNPRSTIRLSRWGLSWISHSHQDGHIGKGSLLGVGWKSYRAQLYGGNISTGACGHATPWTRSAPIRRPKPTEPEAARFHGQAQRGHGGRTASPEKGSKETERPQSKRERPSDPGRPFAQRPASAAQQAAYPSP